MSNTFSSEKKKSKKKLFLSLIFTLIFLGSIYYYFFAHQKQVSYFQIDNQIVFQGKIYEQSAVFANQQLYLPLQFIKDHFDKGITYDEQSQSVIIISNEKILRFPKQKLEKYVNEQTFKIEAETLITENQKLYVEIDQLENIYPFQYTFHEDTKSIVITRDGEERQVGYVKVTANEKERRLKSANTYFSNYYDLASHGEKLLIEAEEDDYYLVRNLKGISGYVKKEILEGIETEMITINRDQPFRQVTHPDWPINLTWEAVYTNNPDVKTLPSIPGVNVVSPTWFKLKNGNGDIQSLAANAYVQWAKKQNYQVWGLFSNDFDPEKTHHVLKNYETRQKMIRQLVQYSEMYNLDGINIDFENVYLKDKDLLTQFVRELTAMAHQAGLIVSMDITFISTSEMWSMFYDREALAEVVDYMIVMAYDEHWGTSPKAGSVASFPWVEQNLEKLLEKIPSERLVLGIPTYTRLWKEQETEGGNLEVSSKALSMDAVNEWMKERRLTPKFDEASGQHYVKYYAKAEKATYKIWLENAHSLSKRGQMVHDYDLAGVASWNRYFANDEGWGAINKILSKKQK